MNHFNPIRNQNYSLFFQNSRFASSLWPLNRGLFLPRLLGPKRLHSKWATLAPKILLYFIHRNGPIFGAKRDLFDLECSLSFLVGVPIRSLQDSCQVLLVLYSILFAYFYYYYYYFIFFFLAEKTIFSFQTLLKETFSVLTCHLEFSFTARVSMTLACQPVQSLSDHKIARTLCVSQERANSRANEWSGAKQMVVPSYLEQVRGEE